MCRGNEGLFKWVRSHDQDGHHAHMTSRKKSLKKISRIKRQIICPLVAHNLFHDTAQFKKVESHIRLLMEHLPSS